MALFANDDGKSGGTLFFASEVSDETEVEESKAAKETSEPSSATSTDQVKSDNDQSSVKLFDTSTIQEANDALTSVGWAGVAPMQGEGEMTSEDPFVQQIDESVMEEMGVGLDQLLNPAKVSFWTLNIEHNELLLGYYVVSSWLTHILAHIMKTFHNNNN